MYKIALCKWHILTWIYLLLIFVMTSALKYHTTFFPIALPFLKLFKATYIEQHLKKTKHICMYQEAKVNVKSWYMYVQVYLCVCYQLNVGWAFDYLPWNICISCTLFMILIAYSSSDVLRYRIAKGCGICLTFRFFLLFMTCLFE